MAHVRWGSVQSVVHGNGTEMRGAFPLRCLGASPQREEGDKDTLSVQRGVWRKPLAWTQMEPLAVGFHFTRLTWQGCHGLSHWPPGSACLASVRAGGREVRACCSLCGWPLPLGSTLQAPLWPQRQIVSCGCPVYSFSFPYRVLPACIHLFGLLFFKLYYSQAFFIIFLVFFLILI